MEYKERIIETLVALSEARELTFMQLLNIAMENERKSIDTAFTVGDTFSNSRSYLNNWGAKSTR